LLASNHTALPKPRLSFIYYAVSTEIFCSSPSALKAI
jgi:hypothetical protein